MGNEILMIVDAVSREKGVEKEIIFQALEAALATATRKRHAGDIDARVAIHRDTGTYDTFRRWEVVADDVVMEFPERQIRLMDAVDVKPDIQVGEFVEEPIEPVEFGRIAAQAAKQVIMQKVREAEREQIVNLYKDRQGEMVTGVVKRLERGDVIVDLGNAEALLSKTAMIPREGLRPGDRIRALLEEVKSVPRGPQLFLSRTSPKLLIELFKLEVPEASEGLITLHSAARDPGMRAKIAVSSGDPRIDPIGACVGMRGSRVQAVSNELAGERVDIIQWSDNPAQFVINSLAPAEVVSIVVDEEVHAMDVIVDEKQLSLAIGRGGQNRKRAQARPRTRSRISCSSWTSTRRWLPCSCRKDSPIWTRSPTCRSKSYWRLRSSTTVWLTNYEIVRGMYCLPRPLPRKRKSASRSPSRT